MTKKHFIALANLIKEHDDDFSPEARHWLAGFCEAQNPRFNRSRWLGYIRGTNGPNGGKAKVSEISRSFNEV